jgi:hypothetical protein
MRTLTLVVLALSAVACETGKGSGDVTSDRLVVGQCTNGPFDLQPTFFASDPAGNTQQIRIQRGDTLMSISDGVLILVNDVAQIRAEELHKPIPMGLPIGVNPPGFPPRVGPNPQVSLTLYLYDTCHVQNGAVYSIAGNITFDSLFSGDRNEDRAADRLTSAHFETTVANPQDAIVTTDPATGVATVSYPQGRTSIVDGEFSFFFERGQPAQPFQ